MDTEKELSVLTFNRSDTRGGAARIAFNLHQSFRRNKVNSVMAVQVRQSADDQVIAIANENYLGPWQGFFDRLRRKMQQSKRRGAWTLVSILEWIGNPLRMLRRTMGIEEFAFRGSREVVGRLPRRPDIVHGHILHGGYFDLRYLSELSSSIPTFLTLHDAWMLSGHCAHSFDCTRWETGCGKCPDLTIPPVVKRDNTAFNWKGKKDIYAHSRLYIATPSAWLMEKVERSMLMDGCVEKRVIPNGIDLSIYRPEPKGDARQRLGLEPDVFIFLFSANGIRRNRWKDFDLMKKALGDVAGKAGAKKVLFLALGEDGPSEFIGQSEIRFMPYRADPLSVASFYNAADVYLHAAKADTFPNVVLEALACGTPVIGTHVGGIPEQIKGWSAAGGTINPYPTAEATGILTPAGVVKAFASAMVMMMNDDEHRRILGINAAADAQQRFSLERQTKAYLDWYSEVIKKEQRQGTK